MSGPPITDSQRDLLARLVSQNRVSMETLTEAGVPEMTRGELARWLDEHVLGATASETTRVAIDELFADADARAEEALHSLGV